MIALALGVLSIAAAKGAIYNYERAAYEPASAAHTWVDSCHRHAPGVVVCIAHQTIDDYAPNGEGETLTRFEIRDTAVLTAPGVAILQGDNPLVSTSSEGS